MPESLLTPSSIKMFGRTVPSLSYTDDTLSSRIGNNNFLQHQLSFQRTISIKGTIPEIIEGEKTIIGSTIVDIQLSSKHDLYQISKGMLVSDDHGHFVPEGSSITDVEYKYDSDVITGIKGIKVFPRPVKAGMNLAITIGVTPSFARIYAFSYEGAVYSLPRPSLFLVHGPGTPVDITGMAGGPFPSIDNLGRTTLDASGVFAREWEFSAPQGEGKYDLRYWEYEKGDFSIRFDMEAGQLEQILLMAALRSGGDMADRSDTGLGIRSGYQLSGYQLSGYQLGVNPRGRNSR